MEFFRNAKVVRLRSHHDNYLLADEDGETVIQDKDGNTTNARWEVEFVNHGDTMRLKSCYGKYLTASSMPFKLGLRGKKVLQTLPNRLDSSLEWEPIPDGYQVRLRTPYGQFLRANGGLPPWRNSITHDVPHRTVRQDWIMWEVDLIEIHSDNDPDYPQTQELSPMRSPPTGKKDKKRNVVKANVSKMCVCGKI